MNPQALGGKFDIVLSLGILYHLPSPLAALELITSMTRKNILLDTVVYLSSAPVVSLHWEEPYSFKMANSPGVVACPSRSSIGLTW